MLSRRFLAQSSCTALLISFFLLTGVSGVAAGTPQAITVMTYNTHHGGTAATPATTDFQLDMIAAENPDVVVLQEAYSTQVDYYVRGLNARQNTTAWHGDYNRTCKAGTQPNCTTYTNESVIILTRLKTLEVTKRLIWAKDAYHVARATMRMSVALADGTPVNVFVCHLPAGSSAATARQNYVSTFKTWAATFAGPKLVGGDFNDWPSDPSITSMKQQYNDAWLVGGTGSGLTHVKSGTTTLYSRIDYWFAEKTSPVTLTGVKVTGSVRDSDHLAVVARYDVASTAETVAPEVPASVSTTLFGDSFDAFDATQWPSRVITGTQNLTIPVTVSDGQLKIGALKESTTGSHYNGVSSAAYNLANNGCAAVQLVRPLNLSSTAYAMFGLVRDTNNLYRWYQAGDSLVAEKKVGGVKGVIGELQYAAGTHQFLRIRKVANPATGTPDVVFETAPSTNGVAGTYVERFRDSWHSAVVATGLKVELKAGTSAPEVAPGTAHWDNVVLVSNCR